MILADKLTLQATLQFRNDLYKLAVAGEVLKVGQVYKYTFFHKTDYRAATAEDLAAVTEQIKGN